MGKKILITLFCILSFSYAKAALNDSVRYKVGQMIVCGFQGFEVDEDVVKMFSRHFIGGVILFEKHVSGNLCDRNIKDAQQVKKLIEILNAVSAEKLFVVIDQEGGAVARLNPKKGFLPTVSAKHLGEINNPDSTRFWASQQAQQLCDLGINVNLAPCLDLAVDPNNSVVVKTGRTFSDDPQVVTQNAKIVIEEFNKRRIFTCLKHFPGHGSISADSHSGFVDITNTFTEKEIKPYVDLITEGYNDIVMVGHLVNKNVDSLPASLSKKYIDEILRKELGYNGVVTIDDLNMGAIADNFDYKDALEKAINAGVDMIIIGNNGKEYRPKLVEVTIFHIMDLIDSGKISRERIDEAFNRIMLLKKKLY